MSVLASIKGFFASLFGGAATGGVLPTVEAGAKFGKAGVDAWREGKRDAQEAAIAKESAANAAAIDAAIRKATSNGAALAFIGLLAAFSCLGCASAPSRAYGQPTGNVERLLARPDFDAAAKAATEWTRDSLKTVNGLEADLQRERARANRVN